MSVSRRILWALLAAFWIDFGFRVGGILGALSVVLGALYVLRVVREARTR